jgi:uncharacterized protein
MSRNEDEFFLREEAEKLHRLQQERLKNQSAAEVEAQKAAHYMKCPKCGDDLQTVKWRGVEIDRCFRCGAIVLDAGELDVLAGQEGDGSILRTFKGLFKS